MYIYIFNNYDIIPAVLNLAFGYFFLLSLGLSFGKYFGKGGFDLLAADDGQQRLNLVHCSKPLERILPHF